MPVLAPARRRLESTGRFEQSLRLRVVGGAPCRRSRRSPQAAARRRLAEREVGARSVRGRDGVAGGAGAGSRRRRGRGGGGARADGHRRVAALRRICCRGQRRAPSRARAPAPRGGPRCSGGWPSCAAATSSRKTRRCVSIACSARPRRRASSGAFGAPSKLQGPLALHTARIAVAPGPAEKAKAHIDRGLVLLTEAARINESEADFSAALDLDPRNVDIMTAFERLCEQHAALGRARAPAGAEGVDAAAAGRVAALVRRRPGLRAPRRSADRRAPRTNARRRWIRTWSSR